MENNIIKTDIKINNYKYLVCFILILGVFSFFTLIIPKFKHFFVIISIFTIFFIIYWINMNISQKNIISKLKFYDIIYKFGAGLFLVTLLIIFSFGDSVMLLIIPIFITFILSMSLLSIIYEIQRFYINKKFKIEVIKVEKTPSQLL